MSRIGNKPISLPQGVSVNVAADNVVTVKGPKGELSRVVNPEMKVIVDEGEVKVERSTDQKRHKSLHGLYRSLINNMVIGVSDGYQKELELVGVGYKASVANNVLELNLGYSHNIYLAIPQEVKTTAEMQKNKSPIVRLESADKELIGMITSKIQSLKKPIPFKSKNGEKGRGIFVVGQYRRIKAGKTAAK